MCEPTYLEGGLKGHGSLGEATEDAIAPHLLVQLVSLGQLLPVLLLDKALDLWQGVGEEISPVEARRVGRAN